MADIVHVVSDEEATAFGKEWQKRYDPPPPPEKTFMELLAESLASAKAQAAKDPPDKDTQGQPAPVTPPA